MKRLIVLALALMLIIVLPAVATAEVSEEIPEIAMAGEAPEEIPEIGEAGEAPAEIPVEAAALEDAPAEAPEVALEEIPEAAEDPEAVGIEGEETALPEDDAAFDEALTDAGTDVLSNADVPNAGEGVALDGIHFPDAAFRDWVAGQFDTDGDGALSAGECAAVTMIDFTGADCASLEGIGHFTKLETLLCSKTQMTRLDLSGNPNLIDFYLTDNAQLAEVVTDNNPKLTNYVVTGSSLAGVDVRNLPMLNTLSLDGNPLTALAVRDAANLETLSCEGCGLESLEISGCPRLNWVNCSKNALTSLDLSGFARLRTLGCEYNAAPLSLKLRNDKSLVNVHVSDSCVTDIDLAGCVKLDQLYCENNALTSLDLSGLKALHILMAGNNQLTSVNVRGCPKLVWLDVTGNSIASVDIGKCATLTKIVRTGYIDHYDFGKKLYFCDDNHYYYLFIEPGLKFYAGGVLLYKYMEDPVFTDSTSPLKIDLHDGTFVVNMLYDDGGFGGVERITNKSPKIISLSRSNFVSALKTGTGKLAIATDDGRKFTLTVKVVDPTMPTAIALDATGPMYLELTETLQLNYTLSPAETATSAVTWKTSNKKIATVSKNGLVKPKKTGSVTITATTSRGKKSAKLKLRIVDSTLPTSVSIALPEDVRLSETGMPVIYLGETLRLDRTLAPDTAVSGITWTTSDKKIATVSKDGLVTAKKPGKVKITAATRNKKKAVITLRVVDPHAPVSVSFVEGDAVTLSLRDKTLKLNADVRATEGFEPVTKLTWSTANKKIATVGKTGLVTAKKAGKVKITVKTANGRKASIVVTVTP